MRKSGVVGAAGMFALMVLSAHAATIIPIVIPSGGVSTFTTGLNDDNIVAGGYTDSGGIERGYFGPLDGSNYTVFDNGGQYTEARGINKDGTIVGYNYASGANLTYGYEFERYTDGKVKLMKHGHAKVDGLVQSINRKGTFIGESWDHEADTVTTYIGKKAKYQEEIDPNTTGSEFRGRGINSAGDMVGYFTNTNVHGFLVHNGVTTVIDYPGARDTRLQSINDKGLISGYWTPDGTTFHAFYYDQNTSMFSQVDVNGSSFTTGFAINNSGNFLINSAFGFYVFCPKAKSKCPAGGTEITDPKSIHVDPAKFLRFTDIRAIKTTPATRHINDGEKPAR